MNQLAAFKETLELAEPFAAFMKEPNELSYDHLVDMFAKIDLAEKAGEPFDESKKGRWLGWAQAAVVRTGFATLEHMKEINVRHSQDDHLEEFRDKLSSFPISTMGKIKARNYVIDTILTVMDSAGYFDSENVLTTKSRVKRLLEL